MVNKTYKIDFWIRETPTGEIDFISIDKLKKKIEQAEGQILEVMPCQNRKLAYRVKKIQEATWGEIIFQMPSEKLTKFLDSLKYDQEILRKTILEFKDYSKEPNSKVSKRHLEIEKSSEELSKKNNNDQEQQEEQEIKSSDLDFKKSEISENNFDEKLDRILNLENLDN